MPYNLNNLSKTALEKIFFVMEEINLSSELHNRNRFIFIRIGKLPDITKEEQTTIIFRLKGSSCAKPFSSFELRTNKYLASDILYSDVKV